MIGNEDNLSSEEDDSDWEKEEEEIVDKIKKTYTLEQFMECPKTKKWLEDDHYQKFLDSCGKEASLFYEGERKIYRSQMSSLFKFDTDGCMGGELSSIIYNNIVKDYNLEMFYEDASLVGPLKTYLKKKEEEGNKKCIRAPKNATRKFNWATKTYD